MNKPAKMLQLLQLLNHRSFVTMDMIRKTCDIPERTAYRYLNSISEANIPVYYDRDVAGYRLTEAQMLKLDDLTTQELAILAACLQLIQCHVNGPYRSVIRSVAKKVAVRQSLALEEIVTALQAPHQAGPVAPDYTEQLSLVLIQMAAMCHLSITATVAGADHQSKTIPITRPGLRFQEHWQITDNDNPEYIIGLLQQVELVTLT